MPIPLSKRIEILQRTGKFNEAKELALKSRWYRCDKVFYRPSDDMVISDGRVYKQIQNLSSCTEVPIDQCDRLDSLAGSPVAAIVPVMPQPAGPRKCCGK